MISWLDTLEDVDSRPIKAVYGDHLPTLSNVEITELELDGRGLDLILHLDLAEFSVVPPRKSSTKRANTVAIELRLLDLGKVSISGVPTRNPASILISPYKRWRPGNPPRGIFRHRRGGALRFTGVNGRIPQFKSIPIGTAVTASSTTALVELERDR